MSETAAQQEAEEALAELHARIPDAIKNLSVVFVTTDDPAVRCRVKARIDALLTYIEADEQVGRPEPPGRWLNGLINITPVLAQVFTMFAQIADAQSQLALVVDDGSEDEDPDA